ncbi:MAG: SDR family NAD(P)-dependent oxidoreductase [Caldilineaceae bacterium]|nr:SDR family NAD(P)-dependent oxidoreductase [Caldilineaceae bacterium]
MNELVGKVAVITGAASGIGRALVERCVQAEMKVVLADVEVAALEEAEDALRAQGADLLAVPTDVANAESVATLAEKALAHFGAVHLLCNNAGVGVGGPIWQATVADWEWVLGVNLWGVIHGIRTFVPLMLAQEEPCHIVNTASIAGLVSTPGLGVYNVTKHGVVTLSETLYQELQAAGSQIGVSVLCPAWVKTRIGQSERNRPGVDGQTPVPTLGGRGIANAIAEGLAPAEVAAQVLAAVREDRFYVLTHPDFAPLIEQRHSDIQQVRNPTGTGLA